MRHIPQRPLGRTGISTTLIGFGALEIGRDWGVGATEDRRRPEEAQAGATLLEVLELGVNLIDTASAYHRSEERIGKYLRHRRTQYTLATKCGEHNDEPQTFYDFSYAAITRSIENSLALLQTNVIDIMQIHFGPDPDKVLDDGGCVRAMREARAKGQVRFLGASVDGPVLDRCIESGDFDVVQVAYSLLDQRAEAQIAKAKARGIGVLIRSGLGGGWLTSRALQVEREHRQPAVNRLLDLCDNNADVLTSLALLFLSRHDGVSSILVGSRTSQHIARAIEALSHPPDHRLMEMVIAAARTT